MAKQSPTDPKFRCNVCKEYFFAPEHLVYYQCPNHGLLCKNHAFTDTNLYFYAQSYYSTSVSERMDHLTIQKKYYKDGQIVNVNFLKTFNLKFKAPKSLTDKCKLFKAEDFQNQPSPRPKIVTNLKSKEDGVWFEKDFKELTPEEKMNIIHFKPCSKKLLKFEWNENLGRWLEFGKENQSDFIKTSKTTKAKTDNSEIRLLVELFSKNILSKEQFIEQILNKI